MSANYTYCFNLHFLKGTVKLVFQPGEEGYAGAYHMLQDGALDDINSIFALHVLPLIPSGVIASRPGPVLAGAGLFSTTIEGKGGHAAAPHMTKDPILAAVFAILALQQIVSRETNPLEANVNLFPSNILKFFSFFLFFFWHDFTTCWVRGARSLQ